MCEKGELGRLYFSLSSSRPGVRRNLEAETRTFFKANLKVIAENLSLSRPFQRNRHD